MSELYELPDGWEWKKLEDIVSKLGDGLHGTPKYDDNGEYYFINGANVKNNKIIINQNTKKVNKEEYLKYKKELNDRTVFVSINGTIGNVGLYNNEKCMLGKSACYFNLLDDINKIYITYILENRDFQEYIRDNATGATIKNVSLKTMRKYNIPLPPLQEQKRIVSKLDTLFEKIDKSIALHQKNMDEADVFMGSVLNDVFEELEEKHLPMKRFDTYTKLSRGHNPPKKDFIYENKNEYMRFIQIRDGSSDKNAVYVPITKKLHTVTKEDLLLVAYRQVGKVFRNMEGAFNVALCKIMNIDKNNLDTTYLYYLIQSKYVKGELLKRSERALIPSMSIEHLKSIEIPLPPLNIQNKTVTYLDEISQKIEKIKSVQKEKMESLVALKASILDQAFRGEL